MPVKSSLMQPIAQATPRLWAQATGVQTGQDRSLLLEVIFLHGQLGETAEGDAGLPDADAYLGCIRPSRQVHGLVKSAPVSLGFSLGFRVLIWCSQYGLHKDAGSCLLLPMLSPQF